MKLRKYVPIEPVVVILKGRPFTLTPNDTIHIGKTINHIVEGEWMGYPITFNDSELKRWNTFMIIERGGKMMKNKCKQKKEIN